MADSEMFQTGLELRHRVLGAEHVDGGMAKADDVMMAFQRISTEWCWGCSRTRPQAAHEVRVKEGAPTGETSAPSRE